MRILVGSPVRASELWQKRAFEHYLSSIDNLELPPDCTADRLFILHNAPQLKALVPEGPIKSGMQYIAEVEDGSVFVCDERTHHWNTPSLLAVTAMRNYLKWFAAAMDYDYYLMADADLVLHPKLLMTLIAAQKDIAAEAIWKNWTPEDIEAVNAWDYDMYGFIPDMQTRFEQFRTPGLYQIGMTGACVLMSRAVIQTEIVNYNAIPNLSFWGEDRAFSIRAACAGFEIWLDTHYPPVHLYRKNDMWEYIGGDK